MSQELQIPEDVHKLSDSKNKPSKDEQRLTKSCMLIQFLNSFPNPILLCVFPRSVLEQTQKEFDYRQKKFNYEEAIVNQLTAIRNGLEMPKKIHMENILQQGIHNS